MRKLLTAGIFGTILSLTGANYADASIISRGFFDEAMENYATNTALDLKANQSDFTELNTQISDSVDNLKTLWQPPLGQFADGFNPNKVNNDINGAFGLVEGFIRHSMLSLTGGWTDSESGTTYLGLKGINATIGILPTETAMSSCSVWRAIDLTQNEMPETIGGILEQLYSAGHIDGGCTHDGYNGPSLPNIIRKLIYGYNYDGHTAMMGINELNVGSIDSTGNVIEPGLRQITNGWTDAKGVLANPGLKGIYDGWVGRNGLHNLGLVDTVELDSFWLYNPENDSPQLLKGQRGGLLYVLNSLLTFNNGFTSSEGGLAPFWKLTQSAYKTEELYTKIGDLPTEIPNVDSIWDRYGFVENRGTPIDLPDTIGGMFAMLFNEDGSNNVLSLRNIMARILMGFAPPYGSRIEGLANLTTAYNLIGDSPIVTAVNANTAKIGTLPTEYATVGAALTAMKSDIDAKNLPSTSDDGQYVLTAKKVGDTITYTWVKMDLTNEEQAQ